MSLFQCQHCGCCENTALSFRGFSWTDAFDWTGIEDRKGKMLCSACGPTKFSDGNPCEEGGKWHNRFKRTFLPLGMFRTARNGNLEHIETGDQDFGKYEIVPPEVG